MALYVLKDKVSRWGLGASHTHTNEPYHVLVLDANIPLWCSERPEK